MRTASSRLAPLLAYGSFRVGSVKSSTRVPTVKGPVGAGTLIAPDRESAEVAATKPRGPPVKPVPVRLIDWGLSGLLSVIDRLALNVPVPGGVKVTEMVQELPAFTAGLHVLVCE